MWCHIRDGILTIIRIWRSFKVEEKKSPLSRASVLGYYPKGGYLPKVAGFLNNTS